MVSPAPKKKTEASDSEELKRLLRTGRHELFVPLADWARREGRLAEAMALLEEGLVRCPERVGAWVLLARTRTQMGQLEKAREHYRKIIEELDPRNLPALRALAVAAVDAGDHKNAAYYLKRWRHEDPEDPEMEDLLAEIEAVMADRGEGDRTENSSRAGTRPPGILEIGLSELEQKLMSAPPLADAEAWEEPKQSRSARAGQEEV